MAIYKRDVVDINLETGNIHRSFLKHSIGTGDSQANQFGVRVYRNGKPVDLTGVSCQGYFRDPQGNNIALTSHGTVDWNTAYLTLPQACYNYEGQFTLAIKLVGGGVTGTVRIVDGVVDNTHTGGAVAPTSAVPTYQEILAVYAQMEDITETAEDILNASSYNLYYGWFVNKSAGDGENFDSSVSVDKYGVATWESETPSTAAYNSIVIALGAYGDVKDVPYTLEFTGDASHACQFTFRLSNNGTWGTGTNPVIIDSPTVAAGDKYIRVFTPAEILAGESYEDTDDVYFSIEQITKNGTAISVNTKLNVNTTNAVNAANAENAVFAKYAGIEKYETAQIFRTTTMGTDVGATVSGKEGKYVISIPANSGATGMTYASIAVPVKQFIADGKTVRVTLKKSNTSVAWSWDAVKLSTQYNQWGPTLKIMDIIPAPGSVASVSYEVDLGGLGIDVSQYETEIFMIFDTLVTDPAASAAVDLTVIYKVASGNAVVATDLEGFLQSDYYTKSEINEIIEDGQANTDIIFWGDSLTAGAGGGGTTYCAVCANALGKTHKNCGVGGETEQTVAARQGGNNLIIPAGSVNGTYSFSQMLDERGKQILPLRQGNGGNTVNPVRINGQDCTLSLTDETYTISGYSGTLLCAVPALFSGYNVYGGITVIFVGANGLGSNTVAERISYIKSMISRIGKKYVVMGISYGSDSDRTTDDAAMREAFGNHFFPTRTMLVNYGLAVAGVTPTSQDTTDIAAGTVPTSLRSDHIHLNANGYTALGKMLAAFIVGLGYAEYPSN